MVSRNQIFIIKFEPVTFVAHWIKSFDPKQSGVPGSRIKCTAMIASTARIVANVLVQRFRLAEQILVELVKRRWW